MLFGRAISGRKPKIATIVKSFYETKYFIDFIVTKRMRHSLETVLPSDHVEYLQLLRSNRPGSHEIKKLTRVIQLWDAEKRYGLRLPIGAGSPFLGVSPYKLLGVRQNGRVRSQTEIIPDSVLWPLFKTCVEYIQDVGPYQALKTENEATAGDRDLLIAQLEKMTWSIVAEREKALKANLDLAAMRKRLVEAGLAV